jgi:hypothetical protein
MRVIPLRALVVGVVLLSSFVGVAHAQTVNRCQAKKKLCVANAAASLLKCHVTAEKLGAAPDAGCTQSARDKFDGGADASKGCFERREAKGGCLTSDDTPALEGNVEAFVNDVVGELDPGYPTPVLNTCSAGKKKCVAKTAKALLKCHAKAEKTGALDTTCTQKAHDKLDGGADASRGCFAKLEARGNCLTDSDVGTLEDKIDAFVQDVVCALDPSTPGCTPTCPTTYELTVDGGASDVDYGWTGTAHDNKLTTNVRATFAVGGCANATPPCGQCVLSGPIANTGGAAFDNRRCRNDSSVPCTTNGDCPGTDNACVFFLGPPQPLSANGIASTIPLCAVTEIASPAAGTLDGDTGDLALNLTLLWNVFLGTDADHPCPRCASSACTAGPRAGLTCTPQGTSGVFGGDAVSLDCPPTPGAFVPRRIPLAMALATGPQSVTLSASSPSCSHPGASGLKCFCGGSSCVGGANDGAACAADSECGAGASCSVPGVLSKPNDCDDATCSANPADTDSVNEGQCAAGPFASSCVIQTYRRCVNNADCPASGDSCDFAFRPRECFTDNGVVGASVSVSGVASPTAPTLGGLTCVGGGSSATLNGSVGLPGLGRFTLRGTAVIH